MAWFHRYNQYMAAVGCGVVFGVSMIPQSLGLAKYREILGTYSDGEEQPLDSDVKDLADRVIDRCLLRPEEEASLSAFRCFGMNPVSRGSVKMKTGAIIGIPVNYEYNSLSEVACNSILVNKNKVDWDSDAGKQLANSLVLSMKGRAFGIAREIQYSNTWHVHVDSSLKVFCVSLAYISGYALNKGLLLQARFKTWARIVTYGLIGCFYFGIYISTKDIYFCHRDNSVDARTAKLGPAYAEGGVEYYEKMLQRNKALRGLLGSEGSRYYTLYGNEKSLWHDPHVMLTTRKDNLQKLNDQQIQELEKT